MEKLIKWLENVLGSYPFSVIFTNLFAAAFCVLLGWLCMLVSPDPLPQALNVLIALFGALVGWALGMFLTPYTQAEAAKFISMGQAVSAFITGYALSKLDRFLEAALFDTEAAPVGISWIRIGLFTCSALLVMLTVFSNRAYFRPHAVSERNSDTTTSTAL